MDSKLVYLIQIPLKNIGELTRNITQKTETSHIVRGWKIKKIYIAKFSFFFFLKGIR